MSSPNDDDGEEDFGSCDRCGCNLTDPCEAMVGLCDQCEWWIDQARNSQ